MWNQHENKGYATLVCFYTKKGSETLSPYEAQAWKMNSLSVYARLKNTKGIIFTALVKRIHFKHHHNAAVTVSINQSNTKYELTNVICDIRLLPYDELGFFYDSSPDNPSIEEAWNNIVDISSEANFQEAVKAASEKNQVVSILYVEISHYGGTTTGIIPDIQQYDAQTQIITTKHEKIFLLEKN
ncbi:MAG: hypothetical protein IJ217_03375 [Clostridia bacterium]|nr:hypothetical protein [Clostridia bacterium]